MKILYLRSFYGFNLNSGGSVAHTAGVVKALDSIVNLTVITNDKLSAVERPQTIISPIKIPFLTNFICELLYSIKLILFLDKKICKYDYIYQRYSGASYAGAYLAKKYNVPLILEYNSSDVWKIKEWLQKEISSKGIWGDLYINLLKLPMTRFVESYNLRVASIIVVVSDALRKDLISSGVSAKKILINPNGIDKSLYAPWIDGTEVREKLGWSDKVIVGFIGTFGPWHGVMEMSRAIIDFFDRFPEKRSNTRFLLIGDGELRESSKQIIDKSPYANYAHFSGSVQQAKGPLHLAACDIYLSPHVANPDGSEFFGSPTKLFEYMAMGRPVIASRLGQIAEILTHGLTGYLVPPGDIRRLADAISNLVDDPELRFRLKTNAIKEVTTKFTWQNHANKIMKKLEEMNRNF